MMDLIRVGVARLVLPLVGTMTLGLLASTATSQDIVGAFDGKVLPNKSVPQIPPQGLPAQVEVRASEDGFVGTLSIKGSSSELDPITELPDGRYSAQANLMGIPVELRFECKEDEFTGAVHGSGFVLQLEARRRDENKAKAPPEPSPMFVADLASLQTDDWRADLAFLREQLPVLHANWFDGLGEPQWEEATARLHAEIPRLGYEAITMRLAQLVALRSDAHTSLVIREPSEFAPCGIRFQEFADGVFVTGIADPHRERLGNRLVAVGDIPIAEVLDTLATAQPAENESWKRYNAYMLSRPAALFGLGLTQDPNTVSLWLDDGDDRECIHLSPSPARLYTGPDGQSTDSLPVSRRPSSHSYWFNASEAGGTAYLAYDSCRDDPGRPFVQAVVELAQAIDHTRPERLIVDLRRNGGGNSNVLEPLLDWLSGHPVLDHPARLFVAIGDQTFSSAMLNAGEFRTRTNATLIGEPTGGKPNAYGEVGLVRLPRSGLLLSYSTQYFQLVDGDPESIAPDRTVANLGTDYFAGRDAVLEAVRTTPPAGPGWNDIDSSERSGIDGVWSGSFSVPAALQPTFHGSTLSFTLAVTGSSTDSSAEKAEAAIQTVLRPIPLRAVHFDPATRTLTGEADLPRFSEAVHISITGQGQSARTSIAGHAMEGWAIRSNSRAPRPMVVRAQFEALATDPAHLAKATPLGEQLADLLRDDPTELNAFAWRLLTEERFGQRFTSLALSTARRLNELGDHSDWQHLDTLALAEFRAGNVEQAIARARRAIDLAGDRAESESLRESLRTFEAARSE